MSAVSSSLQSDAVKKRKFVPEAVQDLAESWSDDSEILKYGPKVHLQNHKAVAVQHANHNLTPVILTALAFFTRLWKIGQSDIVTWDEAHFGKFGSYYIKREFYFDVHPPLGKMLVGLSGYLAGYNGTFSFDSGHKYPVEVNYIFMRVFNAMFGIMCVPLAYYTARNLNFSFYATVLVTLMVLFDNSYTTISRFILLDSMLLFFTFTTMFCLSSFHRLQKESFSVNWWGWLFAIGVSIGCVCSVKWVGLLGTALVGIYTIEDLWNKFADYRMPKAEYAKHWIARIAFLIVVPVVVYVSSFYLHFVILRNSGSGDAQMSSLFQANLRGTDLNNIPLDIAYGSRVTIKAMGYGGGLLHSHVQTYPEGSGQQQVTCYHHKDANNDWVVYPRHDEPELDMQNGPIRFLKNGEVIRLIHSQSGRNLHSHDVAAPLTKAHLEVSTYGNITLGDEKDYWKVEVVDDLKYMDHSQVRALTTAFRLRNQVMGCYLRAANVNLPQWGFKQIEVTCTKDDVPKDRYTHWNVESHWNERLPNAEATAFKSPFLRDLIHLNVAMMTSNNALVPDPDKFDILASEAWHWPIAALGLRMCGWDDNAIKYYLLGNPIVYWASTVSLAIFVLMAAVYLVRWQRHYKDLTWAQIDHIHYSGFYPLLGWVLHYIPFFIMGRVLYVHHYFPALWFAILTCGFIFDHFTTPLPPKLRAAIFGAAYIVVTGIFIYFKDITFGMTGPSNQYGKLRWLPSWNM
ncbi:Dolichyl-phosphate-mannose--protein mannosyltransferase 2 [Neolecta irregularis DAH-3]|uniref:Dolichyl-phosphate-mannose--protein mannosyltransferase n=1 Tax=Neolecta irregularis (strain DAH-3) TaxID=1198029 RepID=A0A1U7LVP5_NEOID|nr:Dolichyl-phosphate-mannose--protein mannosyltransferase 2 [Neolecta irregularis DAH-3]|eukprot:OLL26737.1 Dolichyl-phosphate-mannose--protein mannosyltransferase 2 [Neolecta irregularis DAH-3]